MSFKCVHCSLNLSSVQLQLELCRGRQMQQRQAQCFSDFYFIYRFQEVAVFYQYRLIPLIPRFELLAQIGYLGLASHSCYSQVMVFHPLCCKFCFGNPLGCELGN